MDHDLMENMWQTFNYLKKHKIWNAIFWILTPLPGTDLFEEMVQAGRIIEFDWSKYDMNHVVFKPINFSPGDLYRNFWKLYQSFYSISHIVAKLRHAQRTERFIKFYIRFLSNQLYSRKQVYNRSHPFSMEIS
jgi:hypothetical protein